MNKGQGDKDTEPSPVLEEPWTQTIHTLYPGEGAEVTFLGQTMTPEMLGNFTYGYLGYYYGFSLGILYAGSFYAADLPIYGQALKDELWDWPYIQMGFNYAQKEDIWRQLL